MQSWRNGETEMEFLYLLSHCPNGFSGGNRPGHSQEIGPLFRSATWVAVAQTLGTVFHRVPRHIGLEPQQVGLEALFIWDAGIAGGGSTHCITVAPMGLVSLVLLITSSLKKNYCKSSVLFWINYGISKGWILKLLLEGAYRHDYFYLYNVKREN